MPIYNHHQMLPPNPPNVRDSGDLGSLGNEWITCASGIANRCILIWLAVLCMKKWYFMHFRKLEIAAIYVFLFDIFKKIKITKVWIPRPETTTSPLVRCHRQGLAAIAGQLLPHPPFLAYCTIALLHYCTIALLPIEVFIINQNVGAQERVTSSLFYK